MFTRLVIIITLSNHVMVRRKQKIPDDIMNKQCKAWSRMQWEIFRLLGSSTGSFFELRNVGATRVARQSLGKSSKPREFFKWLDNNNLD